MEIFLNFEVIRERENQMIKLKKDIKGCKVKRNIKSKSKSDRAITLIALVINAKWRHYRRTRRRLTARRDKKHREEQNPYWNLSKFYLIL